MNTPLSISAAVKLVRKAAWAPIGVLVFHAIIAKTSLRTPLDFTMHFLGGAAAAYFFFHALDCFDHFLGQTNVIGRFLFSFALACTMGLFWEFGELFSDVFLQTHIQTSIQETMSDLIADTTGAITSLTITTAFGRFRR